MIWADYILSLITGLLVLITWPLLGGLGGGIGGGQGLDIQLTE